MFVTNPDPLITHDESITPIAPAVSLAWQFRNMHVSIATFSMTLHQTAPHENAEHRSKSAITKITFALSETETAPATRAEHCTNDESEHSNVE
jgi:hypothetical protein